MNYIFTIFPFKEPFRPHFHIVSSLRAENRSEMKKRREAQELN